MRCAAIECDCRVLLIGTAIDPVLLCCPCRFSATLESGQKRLNEVLAAAENEKRHISGLEAFMLYDTFGFPLEITQELASLHSIQVMTACTFWLALHSCMS